MSAHNKRHEQLLAELLSGDEPNPDVAAELQTCPICSPLVDRLRDLQGALDRATDEEAQHLSAAEDLQIEDERELVDRQLRKLMGPNGRSARRGFPRWLIGLAAAVLATLTWFVVTERERPTPAPGSFDVLGGGTEAPIQLSRPIGAVQSYAPFEWRGKLPHAGTWRLRVWVDDASETVVYDERDLIEPTWTLPAGETANWPERIRWRVEAFAIGGRKVFESDDEHAWLR